MEKKHILLVIVLVAALAVLIAVFGSTKKEESPQPIQDTKKDLTKPYKEERVVKEEPKVVLTAFPKDFPVEAGAQNTNSYKYVAANSAEQQSTLEYISQKSVTENQKIFADYLAAGGWKLANKTEQPKYVFYYGQKDNDDLVVQIQENANGQVQVSASFLNR